MTGGVRVLHVETEGTIQELVETTLTAAGVSVESVSSVDTAIERATAGEFDCVLAATDLSDTAPADLVTSVAEQESRLPVVCYGGHTAREGLAADLFDAGATDFLSTEMIRNQTAVLPNSIENAIQIAEQERRREHLKEQRDNLEVLNQMVRHDIRNDLQLVLTYLGLVEDHLDEDGEEYLETVTEGINDAIRLTEKARELSEAMLYTGSDADAVRLDSVVLDQIESVDSTYDDATVTVDDSIPDVTVSANELVDSVFYNILQNAVEHNDKDEPVVEVSATVEAESATVEIADNGPGVDGEEVFARGEKGLDSDGTGIGLYLVETLVGEYGGDVWVEDNDPEGAVFGVTLPRAE